MRIIYATPFLISNLVYSFGSEVRNNAPRFLGILFILIIGTQHSHSQDYVPFPTENARWGQSQEFVGLGFGGWGNCSYLIYGDTLIEEQMYSKLYLDATEYWYSENPPEQIFYVGALREDNTKKIFIRPHASLVEMNNDIYNNSFFYDFRLPFFQSDSTDYLLYDFDNINIGDSISYPFHLSFSDYSYLVTDTTHFEIGGINRKAYQIECSGLSSEQYLEHCFGEGDGPIHFLIEGIGSSIGILGPYHIYDDLNVASILTCFNGEEVVENWDDEEYNYPIHSLDNCGFHSSSFISKQSADEVFKFFPNPAKDIIHISGDQQFASASVSTLLGQNIYSKQLSGKSVTIKIDDLPSGVYILSVESSKGKISTQQFIKL